MDAPQLKTGHPRTQAPVGLPNAQAAAAASCQSTTHSWVLAMRGTTAALFKAMIPGTADHLPHQGGP